MIIITESKYIDWKDTPTIDREEYLIFLKNKEMIEEKVLMYLNEYINHVSGSKKLKKRTFERKYKFSCLPYFHKELRLK